MAARAHAAKPLTTDKPRAAKQKVEALVIVRIIDAPQEMVFRAWTEPEQMRQWYAPQTLTVTHLEADVRPGGKWRKCMTTPEGKEFWRHGEFRQVIPPRRLSFTYFSDDVSTPKDHEMLVTVTLEKLGGKTKLTLRQTQIENTASRDSHQRGWTSSLERLGNLLEQK